MKVLEIKNNLVKIAYDVKDNLALSGFVIIEDTNTPYVAQVVNIKADTTTNYAIVKLLFTFNEEGILKNYDGTIPSLKAVVSALPSKELIDIIPVENPLVLGQLAQQDVQIKVDNTILDNNLLVCSNNLENTNILLGNIIKQINKKVVVFDTDGLFESEQKIVFGKDFKLPLNYDTINFIYDNDLEDVDATSKAIIQDIFIEVQEYTKTLPEGYLPFETFLNVVDQQYRETQITQLILLKNKLLKYKELNVFAENLKDVLNLSIAIDNNDITVIDISDMNPVLQKEIVSYAYNTMQTNNETIYSFVKIQNENSDKKLLKKLIERTNIFTTIVCPHAFKYVPELKEIAQNLILFAPLTLQHDFASYNTFLNKLNQDEFIIYGAHTQNIPFIVELDELNIEDIKEFEIETKEEEITAPNDPVPMPTSVKQEAEVQIEPQPQPQPQTQTQNQAEPAQNDDKDLQVTLEEPQIETPTVEYPDITIDETPVESENNSNNDTEFISVDENIQIVTEPENIEEPIISEPDLSNKESETETKIEDISIEETDDNNTIYNILESEDDGENEEPVSLEEPEIDYSIDDIDVSEELQEPQIIENNNEDIINQAAKDIDKLMYEKLPEEEISIEEEPIDLTSDELTEDDLNLIGDLNAENINAPNFQDIPDDQPPVVPIYTADDIQAADAQTFEPGDKVNTAKYGEGVVSKMTKYGNKLLCLIEFPKIGRRLLDPSVTEITKLS